MSIVEVAVPRTVTVPLGERQYDVMIGDDLIGQAGSILRENFGRRRTLVVTDATVADLHLGALDRALGEAGIFTRHHVVPAGEKSKSFSELGRAVDAILDAGLERSDLVIALGGGVVGDLAGFAAAVVRRGLPFVQIPTTLLAQVDSAVGGKTGINTRHGKNLVGAFHQPSLVLADTATLTTLPERHRRAGYAEIVKIGLLGDAIFFDRLERLGPQVIWQNLADSIETAVAAKAAIVALDERETGRRALLNLGHTFAHAIEAGAGYDDRVVHGEAVALGLALAFRLSVALDLCKPADAERVETHLRAVGLPTSFADIPVPLSVAGMTAAMRQDKKVKDGVLRFVLVNAIGDAFVSSGVDETLFARFLADDGLALG